MVQPKLTKNLPEQWQTALQNEDLTQLAAWPQLVKYQLRETTRSQGYHDPLERFTPLPVGGANAANQLNNTRYHS